MADVGRMPTVKLATPAEASVVLGVSIRTIERRIARGDLQTERDSSGRQRVRIEVPDDVEVRTSADAAGEDETILAVRGAALTLLKASETRVEEARRSASRWTFAALVGFGVASAASAVAVMVSLQATDLRRSVSDTAVEAGEARQGLVEALQEVATLRGDLASATAASDMADERLRQAARHAETLVDRVEDLRAERDALACELADLRVAILLDPDTLTAMTDTR